MAIVERLKGILINPIETFRDAKEDRIWGVLTYFIFILIINAILNGLLTMAGFNFYVDLYNIDIDLDTGIALGISTIIHVFIYAFISFFIASLILHILVDLLTDGNGPGETVKVVAYSATPIMLLGWIPILILDWIPIFTLIGIVWSLALCIIGVREFHGTTTGKAAVAVILSVVTIPLLFLILVAWIFKRIFVAYYRTL